MMCLSARARLLFVVVAVSACKKEQPPASSSQSAPDTLQPSAPAVPPRIQATPEEIEKARKELQAQAERSRRARASLSFDEFEATVYREPFPGGKYIVNGDTPIPNRKQLREFYDENVKGRPTAQLIVAQVGGLDAKWNQQEKTKLTYCVSGTFGPRHDMVVQQMANATAEWQKSAAVGFVHDASQDQACGPGNEGVVFDVRPVTGAGYLARAFFPNEPRPARNVLVDETSFALPSNEKLQLVGILRHELGHTLGFRHEHTRPESGTCFEDTDWRPLTSYDAFSVMHYPQCNGKGDWGLNLTNSDRNASACLYGAANGFTIDPSVITSPCATDVTTPPTGKPTRRSFAGQSVAKDAEKRYGPFAVAPGGLLDVAIGGPTATGDPDLYIRFDLQPSVTSYDCRPYLDGPAERCAVTVPTKASRVFVMVRGYVQGRYDLQVTHTPRASTGAPGEP